MIKEFKVEKDKARLVCIVQENNGDLKEIPIDGISSTNELFLYQENIITSELTDFEVKQVKEFVKGRWDIEII